MKTDNTTQTEVCQCDLCREGGELEAATAAVLTLLAEGETSGVRTLPDNSNAALSLPEAKAGDVAGGNEPDTFFSQPLKLEELPSMKKSMTSI